MTQHYYDTTPTVGHAKVQKPPTPKLGIIREEDGIGVWSDGDRDVLPAFALSEDAAYDLGVELIAQAISADEDDVRQALASLTRR